MSGRELLTPDEVRGLDNRYAILFIRGAKPVMDLKYELTQHPASRVFLGEFFFRFCIIIKLLFFFGQIVRLFGKQRFAGELHFRLLGLILLGFGILQLGLSLKSHDPSQRANGMLTIAGGIVITVQTAPPLKSSGVVLTSVQISASLSFQVPRAELR